MAFAPRGYLSRQLHDHFIPHEGNGHVPKALRHKNLLAYSAVIIGLKALLLILPAVLPAHLLYSSSITQANIVSLTNQSRTSAGLAPLSIEPKLTAAAQARADDMMTRQYFSHEGPDGRRAWSWIRNTGYTYTHAGENLALYFDTAEGVHSGWLASPSHRANLLNENYSEIGVGVSQGEFDGYPTFLVVQFFGHPVEEETAIVKTEEEPKTSSTTLAVNTEEITPKTSQKDTSLPKDAIDVTPEVEKANDVKLETAVLGSDAMAPTIQRVGIRPTDNGFHVEAIVEGAVEVRVLNQSNVTPLTLGAAQTWSGDISADNDGSEWRLLARSKDGAESIVPIADFFPDAQPANVYGGAEQLAPSPFPSWFNYPSIRDGVHGIYLYLIFFLIIALLLKYFINIRLQHWSVIAHTFAVVALAIVMLVL